MDPARLDHGAMQGGFRAAWIIADGPGPRAKRRPQGYGFTSQDGAWRLQGQMEGMDQFNR